MSSKETPKQSSSEPSFDFGPAPTVKDGLPKPIKATDAAVLQATMDGKGPQAALAAAGISMKASKANTYVEHIKNKYTDAQGHLLVELEHAGITQRTLAETIKGGLDAERPVKIGRDIEMVPDHAARHKYVETVLDIQGARAPKHQIVETVQTHEQTVTFVNDIRNNPEVLAHMQRVLQQRKSAKEIDVTPKDDNERGE